MLDLTLLGTGGGSPIPERFLSSMMISYRGRNILIDCGEGTQVAMKKFKTGFRALDIICITHCHGDHIFGLPGLFSTMGNSDRVEPVTIIGPKGIKNVINSFLNIITYLPFEVKVIEAPKDRLYLRTDSVGLTVLNKRDLYSEEIIVSTIELEHSIPCIGYSFYLTRIPEFLPKRALENNIPQMLWSRLQNGETVIENHKKFTPEMVLGRSRDGIKVSYITDTRPIDTIVDFIHESDLFICEGTYGDSEDLPKAIKNLHMTFKEAGDLAFKGKVKELLLTHFSVTMEDAEECSYNAKEEFSETTIGYDGLNVHLTYD